MLREVWMLWESDKIVVGIHPKSSCKGWCVVHKPSDHLLRGVRLDYDVPSKCFVRVCAHNLVHIDPDEMNYWFMRVFIRPDKPSKYASRVLNFPCPDCACGCCDITRKVLK